MIVSEYIEGMNLQAYMENGGKITLKMAMCWCRQIGEILEYLHRQNPPIAYGDLKPDNLMLQREQIVLVDMGSLIRQGSAGKYTGTKEYTRERSELRKIDPEERDGYMLWKIDAIAGGGLWKQKIKEAGPKADGQRKEADLHQKSRKGIEKNESAKLVLCSYADPDRKPADWNGHKRSPCITVEYQRTGVPQ